MRLPPVASAVSSDGRQLTGGEMRLAACARTGEEIEREVRQGKRFRVALVVVATGAYVQHVRLFARSASRLFMKGHEVRHGRCLLLPKLALACRLRTWRGLSALPVV